MGISGEFFGFCQVPAWQIQGTMQICRVDAIPVKQNQQYLIDWHAFRKKIEHILAEMPDENQKKTITMFLLNTFYINPYDTEQDFYPQFYARLDRIAQVIA